MISVFRDINKFAKKWKWLDVLAIFCARILPYLMVLFLVIFAIATKNWQIIFFTLLSALIARFVLNSFIYHFYKEVRPAYIRGANVLIPIPGNPSFPSSHAAVFSAISFTLFLYNIQIAYVFLALSLLIGVARVFCGVHWFRDILGGFASGFLSAIIVYYILIYLHI
jgi:undecaprenyl-diphosphatase